MRSKSRRRTKTFRRGMTSVLWVQADRSLLRLSSRRCDSGRCSKVFGEILYAEILDRRVPVGWNAKPICAGHCWRVAGNIADGQPTAPCVENCDGLERGIAGEHLPAGHGTECSADVLV